MRSVFKKASIVWRNGVFLSSQHLNEERSFIISQIENLKYIFKNYEHVETFSFNEIKLSKGVLEVSAFKAMFSNLLLIDYDINDPSRLLENGELAGGMFFIQEDLNKYGKIIMEKGLLYHIVLDGDYEIVDFVHDFENNCPLSLNKSIFKLKLVPEHLLSNKISIPVCRIISNEAGFSLDKNYSPPVVYLNKDTNLYNILEQFLKTLRSNLLEIAGSFFTNSENKNYLDRLFEGLKYNSLMPNLLNIESALLDNSHPREIFCLLQSILGSLSLLQFTHLPGANSYNHYDLSQSIRTLTGNILSMINNLQQDGERILFSYKEGEGFFTSLPKEVFIINNKTYLFINMEGPEERDKTIHWIEEARICGDNFLESIKENRVRGINRKILNTQLFGNNMLIVELVLESGKYINMETEKILVFNNYNGNYNPLRLTLSWRVGEI